MNKPKTASALPDGSSDWLGVALPKGRLPTRVCNVLDGVNTYGELAAKTAHDMGHQRNVGGKSLQLLRLMLAEKGLCFADECLPTMKMDWRDAKELEAVPVRLAATIACLETTLASLRKLQAAITPNADIRRSGSTPEPTNKNKI